MVGIGGLDSWLTKVLEDPGQKCSKPRADALDAFGLMLSKPRPAFNQKLILIDYTRIGSE
jgi:hypothetical protein